MFEQSLILFFEKLELSFFQKVFPRMPGGCRHQETSGNQMLDKFYRRVSGIFFKFFCFYIDCQKVFSRMPGGCRHQETSGNRVLDNCYIHFVTYIFENFEICFEN